MHRSSAVAIALAFLFTAVPARAYRPFDSTDADVAEHGELELEVGPAGYVRADHRSRFSPTQVINYGVVDRVELVLQGRELVPAEVRATPRLSLVDTGFFVKAVLREGSLQGQSGISIATEAGPWLPTIGDEPGLGFSDAFIFSQRLSFATFHLNLQGARTRARNADLFGGLIAEGPFPWRVRPVLELYVDREIGAHQTYSALAGVIARMSDDLALDAGARLASADGAPVTELRIGFTWAIPVGRR